MWLVAVAPAAAKPAIGITVTFAQSDKSPTQNANKTLYARISQDLHNARIAVSVEDFIVLQLVRAFSVLAMFDVHAARRDDALLLEIEISSKRVPVWPGSDAILTIRSRTATLTNIAFAQRALCGHPHCYPDFGLGFADPELYQTVVNAIIDQWRHELQDILASVIIDPGANYREGRVTSELSIAELGEVNGRSPHAFFQVFVASQLRMVAFCAQEGQQSVGWEQGDRPRPKCQPERSAQHLPSGLGALTLGRAFR